MSVNNSGGYGTNYGGSGTNAAACLRHLWVEQSTPDTGGVFVVRCALCGVTNAWTLQEMQW